MTTNTLFTFYHHSTNLGIVTTDLDVVQFLTGNTAITINETYGKGENGFLVTGMAVEIFPTTAERYRTEPKKRISEMMVGKVDKFTHQLFIYCLPVDPDKNRLWEIEWYKENGFETFD